MADARFSGLLRRFSSDIRPAKRVAVATWGCFFMHFLVMVKLSTRVYPWGGATVSNSIPKNLSKYVDGPSTFVGSRGTPMDESIQELKSTVIVEHQRLLRKSLMLNTTQKAMPYQ